MNIKKNVEVPTNIGRERLGEISLAIVEFCESDDVNVKFECGGKEEAARVYNTSCAFVRSRKLPIKVQKSMNDIYIVRKADE